MASFLGALRVLLEADTGSFNSKISDAAGKVDSAQAKINRSLAGMEKGFSNLTKTIGTSLVAGGFLALGRSTIQMISQFGDLGARIDIAGSTLSALNTKLKQTGTSVEDFATAVNKMNNVLGEASKGESKEAIKAFDDLGLSVTELLRLPTEDRLQAVTRALARMTDQSTQTNSAMAVFGKGGAALIPIIKELNGELISFAEEQKNLGNAITDDQISKVKAFEDQWTEAVEKIKISMANAMPGLKLYLDGLLGIINLPQNAAKAGEDLAKALGIHEFENWKKKSKELGFATEVTFLQKDASGGNKELLNKVKNQAAATAELKKEQAELAKIYDQTRTPLEQYVAAEQRLYELREKLGEDTFIRALEMEQKKLDEATQKTNQLGEDLGFTFSSAFEDAVVGGNKLRDVLQGLAQDIARIALRQSITAPFSNWLSSLFSTGGSLAIPSFDVGTPYVPNDTLAMVHKGERVMTAEENAAYSSGMGGGMSINMPITVNGGGGDKAANADLARQIAREMRSEFETGVVGVMRNQMRAGGMLNQAF